MAAITMIMIMMNIAKPVDGADIAMPLTVNVNCADLPPTLTVPTYLPGMDGALNVTVVDAEVLPAGTLIVNVATCVPLSVTVP